LAPDAAERIWEWAKDGADVAIEASGKRAGFAGAVASLRRGGRVVCVGYYPEIEYGLDSSKLVLEEITVLGSRAGTRADARAALTAVEIGAVRPLVEDTLPLDDVNVALDRLRAGNVAGRLVVCP
jgi:propanol-preferring alcohol dehydrogenase